MIHFLSLLKDTQLFKGLTEEEIEKIFACLPAKSKRYRRGEYVFRQGDNISDLCILIEGKLYIQREDYWGNSNIVNAVEPGEMFGESYIAPDSGALLNNVLAVEDSEILFFNAKKFLTSCPSACNCHAAVIQNLFFAISEKNRKLVQKLAHMAKRSTREKLLSYLSEESSRHRSSSFSIPFNRQQLADFLSVDRSAMSNELCKLRDEGLIRFNKNKFVLIS